MKSYNIVCISVAIIGLHINSQCFGLPIDNSVAAEPSISCLQDRIILQVLTRRSFDGRVFVKGQAKELGCNKKYGIRPFSESSREPSISVDFGSCNMNKVRSANPSGVFMKLTVIVSFHPMFITKVDRAYHVQCFYQQSKTTVETNFNVSMISTESLQTEYQLPLCSYSIRLNDYNGPQAHFLKVGDMVYHRWDCHQENNPNSPFGMLVHSCFVDDGSGNKIILVDNRGCAMDPYILGHPTYSRSLLMAYRETHVFKYADVNQLQFSCQIRLCVRQMGTCQGMTPPKCLPLQNRRRRAITNGGSSNIRINETTGSPSIQNQFDDGSFDLQTDKYVVFDSHLGPQISINSSDGTTKILQSPPENIVGRSYVGNSAAEVCMSWMSVGLLMMSLSVLSAIASSSIIYLVCLRNGAVDLNFEYDLRRNATDTSLNSTEKQDHNSNKNVISLRARALQSFRHKRKQMKYFRTRAGNDRVMKIRTRSFPSSRPNSTSGTISTSSKLNLA